MESYHKGAVLPSAKGTGSYARDEFVPKLVTVMKQGYSLPDLAADIFAGGTVAIVAIPLAMALAIASGVGPERGLFTAIVAGTIISAAGGSRYQIGGPTAAFVAIVYDIVERHGYEGLATATVLAGALLIIGGLCRFGSLIRFVPYPVTQGLTTGIGVLILVSQIRDFAGLKVSGLPADFTGKMVTYAQAIDTLSPATLLLALVCLTALVTLRRKNPKIPGPILVVIVASVIAYLFHLPVETIGTRFGGIPSTLPSPAFPSFSLDKARQLVPEAVAIAILAAIESLLSAVVADGMSGDKHRSNCELVAQGVANIASTVFGGIPATGAFARTATNIKAGARSPLAGILHAAFVLLCMLLLAPLAKHVPLAALAAVLVLVAWNISEVHHFRALLHSPKSDVVLLITTFLLTVLTDITVAVEVSIVLASLLFMKRMADAQDALIDTPSAHELAAHPPSAFDELQIALPRPVPPGVEIFELNGPLFFGIAERVKDTLDFVTTKPVVFILRMRLVPEIDATGIHALEELSKKCQRQGITLILSGVRPTVHHTLRRMGLLARLDEKNVCTHIDLALARAEELLSQSPSP